MIEVSNEFGIQLSRYIQQFGLTVADIASLSNLNTGAIDKILKGDKGIVLKTAEKISNVFGVRYFELGNPSFKIPNLKDLPRRTQDTIKNREEIGIPEINRNYENDIAGNLDRIIHESSVLHVPVTAEEIRLVFPPEIRDMIKATRITDLLKKSGRGEVVIVVGKRGKEYLFQLKAIAEKYLT